MWIFCCGMIRSGSTLQYQITAQLVEDAKLGKRMAWTKHDQFADSKAEHADYEGLKVFKVHEYTEEMASEFHSHNAKGIYIYRDLRDVFVSIMRKNSKTFDQLWKQNLLENCIENYNRWTNLPHMLISRYEDVISDLPSEVKRIADHLDIKIDNERCKQIASVYSLEQQKKRIEIFKGKSGSGEAEGGFDPHSLLHSNHIHSGGAGEWQSVLTPKQIAMIEERTKDWLVRNGYELTGPKPGLLERMRTKRQ